MLWPYHLHTHMHNMLSELYTTTEELTDPSWCYSVSIFLTCNLPGKEKWRHSMWEKPNSHRLSFLLWRLPGFVRSLSPQLNTRTHTSMMRRGLKSVSTFTHTYTLRRESRKCLMTRNTHRACPLSFPSSLHEASSSWGASAATPKSIQPQTCQAMQTCDSDVRKLH